MRGRDIEEYKYKGNVLKNCEGTDSQILNEAIFTFEDDIIKFYTKSRPSLVKAYSSFVRDAISNRINYQEMVSPHTVKVFNVLKSEPDFWDTTNPNSRLNYNSNIFKCIASNIQSKDLSTTLNALISTNSMSPKLFGPPLISNYSHAVRDKYLSAYMAFDLFYAKLFDVDLSKVNMNEVKEHIDSNNIPNETTPDPHAGHNH